MTVRSELAPIYDARKSFHGKAVVYTSTNGVMELYSYGSHVATLWPEGWSGLEGDTRLKLTGPWRYSATTLRHVREFVRQSGLVDTLDGRAVPVSELARRFA